MWLLSTLRLKLIHGSEWTLDAICFKIILVIDIVVLTSTEPLPTIQIDPSTFADDWLDALKDQRDTDVLFLLGSGTELRAHKIVLCAASSFFADVIYQVEVGYCLWPNNRNYLSLSISSLTGFRIVFFLLEARLAFEYCRYLGRLSVCMCILSAW